MGRGISAGGSRDARAPRDPPTPCPRGRGVLCSHAGRKARVGRGRTHPKAGRPLLPIAKVTGPERRQREGAGACTGGGGRERREGCRSEIKIWGGGAQGSRAGTERGRARGHPGARPGAFAHGTARGPAAHRLAQGRAAKLGAEVPLHRRKEPAGHSAGSPCAGGQPRVGVTWRGPRSPPLPPPPPPPGPAGAAAAAAAARFSLRTCVVWAHPRIRGAARRPSLAASQWLALSRRREPCSAPAALPRERLAGLLTAFRRRLLGSSRGCSRREAPQLGRRIASRADPPPASSFRRPPRWPRSSRRRPGRAATPRRRSCFEGPDRRPGLLPLAAAAAAAEQKPKRPQHAAARRPAQPGPPVGRLGRDRVRLPLPWARLRHCPRPSPRPGWDPPLAPPPSPVPAQPDRGRRLAPCPRPPGPPRPGAPAGRPSRTGRGGGALHLFSCCVSRPPPRADARGFSTGGSPLPRPPRGRSSCRLDSAPRLARGEGGGVGRGRAPGPSRSPPRRINHLDAA